MVREIFQVGAEAMIPVDSRTATMSALSRSSIFTWTIFSLTAWGVRFWWKEMKRVFVALLLIVVAGSAKVEAHAFLERAEPAVGGTMQKSPGKVRVFI